jgi:hypothetical protein
MDNDIKICSWKRLKKDIQKQPTIGMQLIGTLASLHGHFSNHKKGIIDFKKFEKEFEWHYKELMDMAELLRGAETWIDVGIK